MTHVRDDAALNGLVTPFCPHGSQRCECCGTEDGPIAPVVVPVGFGAHGKAELCLAACGPCGASLAAGARLPITAATAGRLIAEHERHRTLAQQWP